MVDMGQNIVISFGLCFCFAFLFGVEAADCKCPGPIKYYEDLGCTPVRNNPDDCCPERYNCDNVNSLSKNKCYRNGNEYEIGARLKEEDANPCDIGCVCIENYQGRPTFSCAIVDCFHGPVSPGCYKKQSAKDCCPGETVCPEKEEDRATCVVDGKIYRDGEHFTPASEPNKSCICGEGYAGENVEPFCGTLLDQCNVYLSHLNDFRENCVPVYYSSQSPRTSCSVVQRCQNDKDNVITRNENSSQEKKLNSASDETLNPDMTCKFGNLTMQLGDELSQGTDYSSVCVKCVCEVPPLPTCQRLPDEECDVTKHAPFFNN